MNDRAAILILAVTRMRGGVCVAGMTQTPDPLTCLRWVRPVKLRSQLLPGDIRYSDGTLMRVGDVVAWSTGVARSEAPHIEDVLVDPVQERATLLRHLDPACCTQFCAEHLDRAPADVLIHERRTLCLLRPEAPVAFWRYDSYSGHYEARIAFRAGAFTTEARGIPATDLAWRALGRTWLRGAPRLELDSTTLHQRIGDIFLVVGRGRKYADRHWPLVVGVHASTLPEIAIDEGAL